MYVYIYRYNIYIYIYIPYIYIYIFLYIHTYEGALPPSALRDRGRARCRLPNLNLEIYLNLYI